MAKRVLYSNENLRSYDDYKKYCRECCDMAECEIPAEDSDDFIHWQNNESTADWEDFEAEVKCYDHKDKKSDGYVVTGSLGLWDGRRDIQPTLFNTLIGAIEKCISGCDYIEVSYDDEEDVIVVSASHHDGTNHFVITEINGYFSSKSFQDFKKIPYTLDF